MHKLLPLVLICALLCGCGRSESPQESVPAVPTESVAGQITTPEEYGGAVTTIPLNLSAVRGLRVFNGEILLLSGDERTTLTLLSSRTLEPLYTVALDFLLEQNSPSLVLHPEGTLSFYDPNAQETIILDRDLLPIRRIPAPGALIGQPILSPDGRTLFYCTASHVRALDLESGVNRCVKEMSLDAQQLVGVHMDGTVLQCSFRENGQNHTLFLRSEDGTLLHQSMGTFTVTTGADRYYAQIPAGSNSLFLFGKDAETPQMFLPADFRNQVFFLPAQKAALTQSEGFREILEYRKLDNTHAVSRLSLEAGHNLRALDCLDQDTLMLLSCHDSTEESLLILWDPLSSSPEKSHSAVVPYHTVQNPDLEGLLRCKNQAAQLAQQYGIHILIGEEAALAAPESCHITPEHLVPVIQWELSALEQRLSRYPNSMIRDTAAHFSRLNLCLVREITYSPEHPAAAPGLQFLADGEAYLVIPVGMEAGRAFDHQLFHLMDIHILTESNSFDRWSELNPAGFRYDYDYSANSTRDSGVYLFAENRSFADTFSMSYPTEDRARILEYAMLPGQKDLFRPKAMQAKLRTLCKGIRDAYGLKASQETYPWEQYLE